MADKTGSKKRNWVKILLVTGGIAAFLFVVLVGIAAVVIPKNYPPEKLKSMAVETISKQLNRKVSVGDVRFNLLKGFEITDLKIGNRMEPGWAAGNMVSAKRIAITYRLLPLLWLQVRLGEILLIEPQILIERKGLNEFNFSDMVPSTSAPADKTAGKTPAPGKTSRAALLVVVDTISIQGGKLTYIDYIYKPANKTELPDLDLKVKNISLTGGKTTFSVKTPIKAAGGTYQASASGAYKLFFSKGSVKGLQVKGDFSGIGFQLSGEAKNVMENAAPDVKGTVTLDLAKVPALLPKGVRLPPELKMSGSIEESFTVGGTLKEGFKISSTTDATGADIRFGDAFTKPSKMKAVVKADTLIGTDFIKVPLFDVLLNTWELKGSAENTGMPPHPALKGNPAYALSLTAPKPLALKDLPDLVPMVKDLNVTGEIDVDVKYSGKPMDSRSTKLNGAVAFKGINAGNKMGKLVEDFSGKLTLKEDLIEIPQMKFKLLGSATTLAFKMSQFNVAQLYDPAKLNALITYQLNSNDINLENLLALGGPPKKKGEASAADKKASAKAKTPPPQPAPISAGLRLDGGMAFKSFYLKKIKFTDATMRTTLAKKVFKTTASVKGFEGNSSGSFQMNLAYAVPPYSFTLKMAGVQAQAAIGETVDSFVTKNADQYKDKVTGTMNFDFAGEGKGFDAETAPKNLKGKGTFSVTGVRIKALAMLGGLFKNLKGRTEEMKMDRLDGTLSIADEKVALKATSAGSTGKLSADGVIGFDGMYAPQMMILNDVRKEYIDSEAFLGSLPGNVKDRVNLDKAADSQGLVPIDFKLTGPVSKAPGVGAIDLTRLMKNIVGNETKAVKQAVQQKAGEAVQDKLKGLFKR